MAGTSQPPDPTGRWERREPLVALAPEEAHALLAIAAPGHDLVSMKPLTTGLVNTNYRVELDGMSSPVVLRLYARDGPACAREDLLLRLGAGTVPVPAVLYADPTAIHFRMPWMLMTWAEGVPLPEALVSLPPEEAPALAAALGQTAAAIGSFAFDTPGFFGPDLTIVEPLDAPAGMTRGLLRHLLFEGRAGERLGADLSERLWAVVEARIGELDALAGRVSLVHADFRDSNLLVARDGGKWRVTGVLDWEFSFAGPSLLDLGQLLRRERATLPPGFADHVVAAYRARGGFAPPGWRRMALLLDLMNLCGFADMPATRGAMRENVTSLIQATVARLEAGEPDA